MDKSGVYLIHFSPAYRHAGHYLGYADDIARRLVEHLEGRGARLTQVAVEAGCDLELVRTWPGKGRKFERRLKNRKNAPKLCPICQKKRRRNTVQPGLSGLDAEIDFRL